MSNSVCILASLVRLPEVGCITKKPWSQNGMVLGEDVTENAAFALTDVFKSVNHKMHAAGIVYYLVKVFDYVNYEIS
jgi:hypothetical protein